MVLGIVLIVLRAASAHGSSGTGMPTLVAIEVMEVILDADGGR